MGMMVVCIELQYARLDTGDVHDHQPENGKHFFCQVQACSTFAATSASVMSSLAGDAALSGALVSSSGVLYMV